jgi:hypothetical protein
MQNKDMFSNLVLLLLLLISLVASEDTSFTYLGFQSANLSLDGIAGVTSTGLLRLTNDTRQQEGHAFFPNPITFKNSSNGTASSFATTFVFAIISEYPTFSSHGFAFVIAPTRGLPGALQAQYLGIFNSSNDGNSTNHVVVVELDTIQNSEFRDINDNHAGIDINGMTSVESAPARYYADDNGVFRNLTLINSHQMRVWVEYDGVEKKIEGTMAPINAGKPKTLLLSLSYDLSPTIKDNMYVGFSSSTGSILTAHYVLGWSFKVNGQAPKLDVSQLPKLPRIGGKPRSKFLTIGLPVIIVSLVSVAISAVVYVIRRKKKHAKLLEDWELQYGPHRFKYKDLYIATKGFRDKELLSTGGFGRVYRGILPTSKIEIAVKKVSHESR